MRKLYTLLLLLIPSALFAQGVCNPAGNVLIYTNYDGGDITIDIDQDIPDIRIGICSYESIDIEITGDYVDNVTQVLYAGYDDDGTTSISGVATGITDILLYPPATLSDEDGYPYIICAYDCDTDYIPGGCNTVEQITDYFLTELGGTFRYSYMQYGVWAGGDYYMSDGGNCCYGADPECFIDIESGKDPVICSDESATIIMSGADTYIWTPEDGIDCSGDCATVEASPDVTTTYIIMGTDADGCYGYDTITVYVDPAPVATITVSNDTAYASGGMSYQWFLDGILLPGETGTFIVAPETGNYSFIAYSAQGCSDTSAIATVVVEVPQGLTGVDLQGFQLYPNPVEDVLTIEWTEAWQVKDIQLVNHAGQLAGEWQAEEKNDIQLNLQRFDRGVYILQLVTEDAFIIPRTIILK